ncbi:hypothetical protein EDD11_001365 [Mortierella claussenii]|nr:hypothetical protein EDD11_001365 [Mortierella claussenii]
MAVHFLYASPFRLLHTEPNCHWTVVERTRRYDSLLHLLIHSSNLLSSTEGGGVSRLPRYGPEVPSLPTPSTVDYLSYYTDMFHDPMLHETFMTLFPSIPNCYLANVIWYRSMVETRNRIELAMMDRLLPQITSLAVNMPIQVPRIKYHQMANLRRLEVLGTDFCMLTDQDLEWERTLHTNRASRAAIGYTMTRLDKMLTFIWDHQRLFGTLRELKIEDKAVSIHRQPGARLIELVEAMGDHLEALDVQYWPEAMLFLDRIPTRNLKCLLLHLHKEPEPLLEESGNMAAFLSHCPRLEELCMYTTEMNLFQTWRPVRGFQDAKIANSQPFKFQWQTVEAYHISFGRQSRMRRLNIAGLAQDVIAVANEATDLFASTLETLAARSWFSGKLSTAPLSWSGSTLARLTDLDLEGEVAWTFDYASLLQCPRLCRIRLAYTGPMPSRSSKKQPAITNLPRVFTLQDLELMGNWETLHIRGWPAVIAQIRRLERLDLSACEGISAEQVFLLVREAIEQSAQWRQQEEGPVAGTGVQGLDRHHLQHQGNLVTQYGHCRLRWVIVSKRLEDHIMRLWYDLKRWLLMTTAGETPLLSPPASATPSTVSAACVPSKAGLVATASPFVVASVERIRFSFVVTARPSR